MQESSLFTDRELEALIHGRASIYRGRIIPIMRGAEGEGGEGEGSGGGAGEEGAAAERTLTQAQVDRIVQERVARAEKKYEGFDDFKAKAEKFDEAEQANQTELQKAQERAAALEKERDAATARAKTTAENAALIAAASKKGFADPADAVALVDRSTLEYNDDGTVKNAAQAVDSLLEAKPHLAGPTNRGGSADQGAREHSGVKQLTHDDLVGMSVEDYEQAKKDGKLKGIGIG